MSSSRGARLSLGPLVLGCLFASGFAALVYEVAWIRRASLVFGSTTFAVGTVVGVFFFGLALGSDLFGRVAVRTRRPLVWFGRIEIALGALAAASPLAFALADRAYGKLVEPGAGGPLAVAVRLGLVAAVLLPPTLLLGASLPLFVRHFVVAEGRVGRSIGLLYALNTLGAAAGAAATGFGLLPALGLRWTIWTGALLDVACGALVLALRPPPLDEAAAASRESGAGAPETAGASGAELARGARATVFGLIFTVGFVALGLEVLWTRQLSLLQRNSVFTYALSLTVVLLGIVIGSVAVAPWLDRWRSRARVFGALQLLTGASILVLANLGPAFWHRLGGVVATPFLLLLPTATLSGASFPLAVRMVVSDPRLGGLGAGRTAAASSLGGIAGSLAVSLLFLPRFGLAASFLALAGLALALAAATWAGLDREASAVRRVVCVALAAGVWIVVPRLSDTRLPADFLGGENLVDFHEGYGSNVAVVRAGADELRLEIDRWWQGTNAKNHQIVAAHLPMLVHPDPRSALVVGLGTGQTAARFLLYPLERLDVVDIEPTLFDFVREHFESGWMDDPRVRLVRDDGRTFVRHGRERYEVISLEVGQIFRPGVAFFYTADFYRDAAERLTDGGLLVQFVPLPFFEERELRGVLRTFLDVFPESVLWYNTAELLLIGRRGAPLELTESTLERLAAPGPVHEDLRYAHWGGAERRLTNRDVFLAGFLVGPAGLRALAEGGELYRDDRPVLDYATRAASGDEQLELPLLELLRPRLEPVATIATFPIGAGEAARIERLRELDLGQIEAAAHVRQSERLRAAGDHRGALAELERAVEANGEQFSSRLLAGDSAMFLGRVEEAREHFATAARIRPEDGRAQYGLAVALFQLGRFEEAVPRFEAALQARPDDALAHNGLGATLSRLGEKERARKHFAEALRLQPGFTEARANLQRLGGSP